MPEHAEQKAELREYLLGIINLQAEREKIEEQVMLDQEHFDELLRLEEELIQEYADGKLDSRELNAFEEHFLISPERRRKVKFAKALRKYINEQAGTKHSAKKKENFWKILKSLFSSPLSAAGLAVFILSSLLAGYFYFRASPADSAMHSLREIYKQERPLETRITDFGYAPFRQWRGTKEEGIDVRERE